MQKQIKAGDKVKCIKNAGSGSAYLRVGEVYTVEKMRDPYRVVLSGVEHPYEYWSADRFELVSEQPTFKEGDRVVIARKSDETIFWSDSYMTPLIGKEGVVRCIYAGCYRVAVGAEVWNYEAASLELVESAQPAAGPFLIAGMTTEYATQESAEKFLAEYGDNGKEYTITQVVRRVRVNRTAALETI